MSPDAGRAAAAGLRLTTRPQSRETRFNISSSVANAESASVTDCSLPPSAARGSDTRDENSPPDTGCRDMLDDCEVMRSGREAKWQKSIRPDPFLGRERAMTGRISANSHDRNVNFAPYVGGENAGAPHGLARRNGHPAGSLHGFGAAIRHCQASGRNA